MLNYTELYQTRVADLLREAERERLANAARRPRSLAGWVSRRRARRAAAAQAPRTSVPQTTTTARERTRPAPAGEAAETPHATIPRQRRPMSTRR